MALRHCSVCFDSGIEQTATTSKLLVQNGITITFWMKIESSIVFGLFVTAKLCAVATKGDVRICGHFPLDFLFRHRILAAFANLSVSYRCFGCSPQRQRLQPNTACDF